jgi:hypothetical protein
VLLAIKVSNSSSIARHQLESASSLRIEEGTGDMARVIVVDKVSLTVGILKPRLTGGVTDTNLAGADGSRAT